VRRRVRGGQYLAGERPRRVPAAGLRHPGPSSWRSASCGPSRVAEAQAVSTTLIAWCLAALPNTS
jgi:hypothetical protein